MAQVSFTIDPEEVDLIDQIVERAREMDRKANGRRAMGKTHWRMDIIATHANGNPLRLSDLLAADDFNFAHDVFGIGNCLDRETGKLLSQFRPRFSQRVTEPVL